jgi:predicted esterase
MASAGPPPEQAAATLILVHGRGATGEGMLSVMDELRVPALAALAPQAAGRTWYPQSFLAPLAANQPFLDAALAGLEQVVTALLARDMASDRIGLLGFSQGACLVCEFAARHARRYGAVIALTGGLIGPDGTPRNYPGSFAGTPVFLAGSDLDPHVPFGRVRETEQVFTRMGARVEVRRYPGMAHTISADELDVCRAYLRPLAKR